MIFQQGMYIKSWIIESVLVETCTKFMLMSMLAYKIIWLICIYFGRGTRYELIYGQRMLFLFVYDVHKFYNTSLWHPMSMVFNI